METEREFSFKSYLIYAVRKWIIPVLCVIVGIACGVFYSLTYKTTNIVLHESTLSFDVTEYSNLYYPGDFSDSVYSLCSSKGSSIIDIAVVPKLKSDVYDKVKDIVYPKEKAETVKVKKFLENLQVSRVSTFAMRVDFAYDIKSDEDIEVAKNVVKTYIDIAKAEIYAQNAGFCEKEKASVDAGGSYVLTSSTIGANYDTSIFSDLTDSNTRPSLIMSSIGGAGVGLVVAIVIITLMYIFTKYIKRMQYLVGAEDARVFSEGADPYANGSLVKLATVVTAEDVKSILVTSVNGDPESTKFAKEFSDSLASTGKKVKFVEFGEGKEDWRKYFATARDEDAIEVYSFDCAEKGTLGYISAKAGNTCFVVNQSVVTAREFVAGVEEVKVSGAK